MKRADNKAQLSQQRVTPAAGEHAVGAEGTLPLSSTAPRYWRHEVALVIVWRWFTAIDQTRCFTTGILGRHACMVHSYGYEALLTMYQRPNRSGWKS